MRAALLVGVALGTTDLAPMTTLVREGRTRRWLYADQDPADAHDDGHPSSRTGRRRRTA